MKQTTLTRDTIDDPALWCLSMMICSNTVEVVLRRIVGEPELLTATLVCDANLPQAAAIEELVYANPLLLAQFGKTDIVVRTDRFQIVPPEVAADADAVEAMLDLLPHPEGRPSTIISDIDSRNAMVAFVDHGVANFIARTFYLVKPIGHLTALGRYFEHQSRMGNSGKMYVNLSGNSLDIIAYNALGLTIANSFDCPSDDNAAYYILAAAKTSGFDFSADEIFISGSTERRAALMPRLRRFANYVMPTIFPSSAYCGDHHKALRAPFELIILPLCE